MSGVDKQRWPHARAMAVAIDLRAFLAPHCEEIMICGSLRRQKETVGDIEIVYVSQVSKERELVNHIGEDFWFHTAKPAYAVDEMLDKMLLGGVIEKRLNKRAAESWGERIKLAIHKPSGIPVDFFACERASWWNYVVCRTGGAMNNTRIAGAAKAKGWKWHPYSPGFSRRFGPDAARVVPMKSERDVFEFVGLPYLEPEDRP